jgi:predicted TPR repeat methyltransferase
VANEGFGAVTMDELRDALRAAREHHEAGRLPQAEAMYRQILRAQPDHPDALHLLGAMAHQLGNHLLALELIGRAIAADSCAPVYHSNLGSSYRALGRLDEAIASFRQALALKHDYADAHYNLGVALSDRGELDEAAACFRTAIALQPDHVSAHHNLGVVCKAAGKPDEALACWHRVVALQPDHCIAQHLIAAMTGAASERAPDQYVIHVFDDCADSFDAHLVEQLRYDAPLRLAACLAQLSPPPAAGWDVLDLGCGTGLVGAALAHQARHLVGVDLSAAMLAQAQARSLYQRLERCELLSMMQDEPPASYDVIAAADVFIYVGNLDGVVREANRLLRRGGLFAFSVEAFEPESLADGASGYRLTPSGRYAHSTVYLDRLAATHDFRCLGMRQARLRLEEGKPVQGWLAVWEK